MAERVTRRDEGAMPGEPCQSHPVTPELLRATLRQRSCHELRWGRTVQELSRK